MGSSNGKPVLRDEDINTIMQTSGMTEQQIRKDFDIFVAQYPTGWLSTLSISNIEHYDGLGVTSEKKPDHLKT